MALRILWDIEEAAILLDALVKVKEGQLSRNEAFASVSRTLRARAVKSGVEIDEVFRNISGIRLQMSIIEYLFTNGVSGLYIKSPAKVFKEAVALYKNDRTKFCLILKQAKSFDADGFAFRDAHVNELMQSKQEKFHNWLAHEVTPAQLSELYVVFGEIDEDLKRDRVLNKSIYEVEYEWELAGVIKHINGRFNFRKLFNRDADKKTFALNLFKRYLKENPDSGTSDTYSPAEDTASSYAQNTAPYAEIKGSLPKADVKDNDSVKRDSEKFNILLKTEQNPQNVKNSSDQYDKFNTQPQTSPLSSNADSPEEDTAKGENFLRWLKNKYRYVKAEEIYFMLADVDAFQRENKFLDKSIFDISNLSEYDKFFARLKRRGFLKSERTGEYIHTSDSFQALTLLKSYIAETYPKEPEEQAPEETINSQGLKKQTAPEAEADRTGVADSYDFQDSDEQTAPQLKASAKSENEKRAKNTIDFNDLNYNYDRIKPTHFNFFDETEESVSDWQDLYVKVMSCLNDEYPDVFKASRDARSEDGALIIAGTIGKNEMKSPVKMENGSWYIFIEKSIETQQALKNIRLMLDKCLIDYENLIINYEEIEEPLAEEYEHSAQGYSKTYAEDDTEESDDYLNIEVSNSTEAYFNEDTEEEDLSEDIYFGEALEGGNSVAEEAADQENSEDEAAPLAYSETEFYESEDDYIESDAEETEAYTDYDGGTSEEDEIEVLNWSAAPDLAHTKPVSFTYYDEKDIPVNSWRELYSTVIKKLLWDYPGKLEYYINGNFNSGKSYDLSRDFNDLRMPLKVDYGLYLETNLNAKDIFHKLKTIIKICGVDLSDITVRYRRKTRGATEAEYNSPQLTPINQNDEELSVLNWTGNHDLAYTAPVDFSYFDEVFIPAASWTDLYVKIVELLLNNFSEQLLPYENQNFYHSGRCDFGRNPEIMARPKEVILNFGNTKFYLETNIGANDISKKIKRVIEICGLDNDDITVRYRRKPQTASYSDSAPEFEISSAHMNGDAAPPQADNTDYKSLYRQWALQNGISDKLLNTYLQVLSILERSRTLNIWDTDFENLARLKKQYPGFSAVTPDNKKNAIFAAFWTLAEFTADYKAGKVKLSAPLSNAPFAQSREESGQNAEAAKPSEIIPNIGSAGEKKYNAPLSPDAERYKSILEKYYSENGYMPGSAISQHKFVNYYFSEYGENPPRSGRALDKEIEAAGIRIGDRILPGLNGSQTALLSDIVGYIDDILDSGISAVYLDAVFEKFKFRVADELNIYSWSNLTSLLSGFEGKSFIICGNHCRYPGTPVNTEDDVINVIRNYAEPKYVDEISEDAEFITADKLEKILKNHDDIINTGKRTYFYSPNFPLGEEDVKQIASLLDDNVGRGVNLSSEELKTLIDNNLPYVSQSIEEFETSALIKFLKSKLDSRFDFNGTKISSLNSGVSLSEAIREFARSQREFTLSELEAYINDINANPALWYKALDGAVRVSEDLFVNKEHISFDSDAIDAVLENYVTDNYISIQDVTIFLSFPSVGYPWTPYLLESYVKGYSKKFKLIHPSFAKYGVSGAIVRKSFSANDMHSLAADILSKDLSHGFEADSALEYLVETGYMNRKTMYDIDEVLAEAKQKYLSNLE